MTTPRHGAAALLAVALAAAPAGAATLEDYARRLAEHPRVAEILEQGARFKALAEGEMGLPDPHLLIGMENMPVSDPAFDRFLPTSKVLGIRQEIPNYAVRQARSAKQERLSQRQQLAADYALKRLESILIGQLAELRKIRTLERLAEQQLELYRALEDDLQGQLEAGRPVYGRFSELDVARAAVGQRLNDLAAERIAAEERLTQLVGEVPPLPVPSIPETAWNRDGNALYPVRLAAEDVRVAAQEVAAADAASGPNYGVQAVYKQREAGRNFSGDDWLSIQATVSVPLWFASNQEPKQRAARAGKRSAQHAHQDAWRDWVGRMVALEAERDVAHANIVLIEEKQAALRDRAAAAARDYEAGNAPLETVLDARGDELALAAQLAEQRHRHIRLSAQFNSHLAGGSHESD